MFVDASVTVSQEASKALTSRGGVGGWGGGWYSGGACGISEEGYRYEITF